MLAAHNCQIKQILHSIASLCGIKVYIAVQMNGDKIIVKVIKRDVILSVEMIM